MSCCNPRQNSNITTATQSVDHNSVYYKIGLFGSSLFVLSFTVLPFFVVIFGAIPNVILVPILAFDRNKYRLGYGKGFYDRYLNKYLKKFKNILTVGVAFSFQKYHKLPSDKNDVKLNFILTEKGIN